MYMDAVYLNDLDDVWGCFRRLDSQSVLSKLQFVHQDKKKCDDFSTWRVYQWHVNFENFKVELPSHQSCRVLKVVVFKGRG